MTGLIKGRADHHLSNRVLFQTQILSNVQSEPRIRAKDREGNVNVDLWRFADDGGWQRAAMRYSVKLS